MENYFILLGLSFNPIESDESKIKEAIEKKREQWQKDAKNPRKQIQAKENIAKIHDIEDVMLNPSKRKLEAEKALALQEKYISNLKNDILLLSIKGYIEDEEFSNLINKYGEYSIDENTILKYITVPIGDNKNNFELEELESIPADIASQLEMYFKNLNIDDMSLYNLYGLDINSTPNDVIRKAQAKLKEMLEKGTKNNTDEIEQKIAGLAIKIMTEMPDEYDNYISGNCFIKMNEYIETAVGTNNSLTLKIFDTLIEIAKKEYNLSDVNAASYIIMHCQLNNIDISQDVLIEYSDIENGIETTRNIEVVQTKEEEKYTEINTNDILNKMLTPINTLLIHNKNRINQICNYLNQYIEKRQKTGSAMSEILSYGSFIQYGIFSVVDIFLFLFMRNSFPQIFILALLAGILINAFGIITIYPAFSQWNKMQKAVKKANENNDNSEKLYNEFIELNFNLLVDNNNDIKNNLNKIKAKSTQLRKDTENLYEIYTRISKQYQQKDYYLKINAASLAAHILIIVITFIL